MNFKNIIITAGGTSESIDKVRKITNSSSGKLGIEIANEFINYDSQLECIFYICSKKSVRPNNIKIKVIEIESVIELENAITDIIKKFKIDCVINSMAVSDYMVKNISNSSLLAKSIEGKNNYNDIERAIQENKNIITGDKISSNYEDLIITLKPTPKIISLIKKLDKSIFLVGFKLLDNVLETELINVAINLMNKNNCDLVVANDLENIRNNNHKAFIIDTKKNVTVANGKSDIAKKLIHRIYN